MPGVCGFLEKLALARAKGRLCCGHNLYVQDWIK